MTALQLQLLMMLFAGWVNRSQQDVIECLQAENRVLREQLGDGRLRFTDGQRRRLALRAKAIGRKGLFEISTSGHTRHVASLVPEADRQEIRWQPSAQAGPPKTAAEIERLILRMAGFGSRPARAAALDVPCAATRA